MSAFEGTDSWGGALMRKFFNWYSPKFEAYSFALARNNEYEADAIAAELTSPETASHALINVHATSPYLDNSYWENFFRYADEQAEPPHAPFEGLATFLSDNPIARDEMKKRVEDEMSVETHYADTHPCLKDRVNALNAEPQEILPPEVSAADAWLGEQGHRVREDFDREWLAENSEAWNRRYEYVRDAKSKLEQFSQQQAEDLSDGELWDYAYWTNEFQSDESAVPLFKLFQQRHPEDPDAAFFIGLYLLKKEDAAGLEQLKIARKSASLVERCAHIGFQFLDSQKKEEEANRWWQECVEQNEIFIAAQQERASVDTDDQFSEPEIGDELLQQLVENLKKQKKVGKVWLAQKVVEHFPEHPVYIVAFSLRGFSLSSEGTQKKVAEELQVDGDFFVVCKSGETKALAKKVIRTGTRII